MLIEFADVFKAALARGEICFMQDRAIDKVAQTFKLRHGEHHRDPSVEASHT